MDGAALDTDALAQILRARHDALDAARPEAVAQQHAAGALTARERLARLLDGGSFEEYGVLAGTTSQADDAGAADGLVAGAGRIEDQPVLAAAYDHTVANGTQSDRNQRKFSRLLYLAIQHRWPLVCFVDGDGARPGDPPPAPPIVSTPRGRWDVLDGMAELSGWAPTVAVVAGRALDGNAGVAMLADCVIATRSATFGSRSVTTREITERSSEAYACDGHVDLLVETDDEAADAARRYLSYYLDPQASFDLSDTHELLPTIIPDNRRRAYDMRKNLKGFADDNSVLELGRSWATSMITAFARLGGHTIGIFANQPKSPLAGAIDAAAADKAARFVELCDAYEFPLVSFIDNPGYMVGPQAEQDGIARHHARPLSAIHHRTVPLYSVQLRKAYGLGPYAMSGFGASRIAPDLRLAWPTVESGGMSLEGAAYLVKRKEILAASSPAEARAIRDAYANTMRDAASGLRAGRTFAFDDIVHPLETRDRILAMLERVPRRFGSVKKHPIDLR